MKGIINRGAVASLIISRTIYAVNWFNMASIFVLVAPAFNQNISGLGLVTGSFYLGLGIFQIPGGVLAAKIGPKKTAVYGTVIASLAAFLCAFSTEFSQIILLRFLVGLGMALFFSPGVTLIAKYFRRESEGLSVGWFNAVFYLGGAVGFFVWSVLAEIVGWRLSVVISGGLGLLTALSLVFFVPKDSVSEHFTIRVSDLRRILLDRWLLLLNLELFGVISGSSLVTTFMVYYLADALKVGTALAAFIGSLAPLSAILASPIFGLLHDKTRNARKLLFISGATLALGLSLASLGTIYFAAISSIMVGFCLAASLTIGFAAAREVRPAGPEYETLAVSWVNNIQMFAGFWSPIAFSILVVSFGYSRSWLIAASYTFLLISIILLRTGKQSVTV
ncbi:MAG TPA: MFS transporter [Candidatus Bathyarchaeia archaeon]|nr:MFS transporter [Candidatus Bathyarchaeia archaeon]